jgi:hypothetical protein
LAKLSLASENVGRSRRQIGVKNVKKEKCISSGNMAAGKMFHPREFAAALGPVEDIFPRAFSSSAFCLYSFFYSLLLFFPLDDDQLEGTEGKWMLG